MSSPADQETWIEAFAASADYEALSQASREYWDEEVGSDDELWNAVFAWAFERGYQEALANQDQAKVYAAEPQAVDRCEQKHPKEGWQCTMRAGHRGEHAALAPSAWHPDYAVKMDGTPNQEQQR